MRAVATLCCCLLVLPAWGEETTVYKRVRPDGTIEFSDTAFPESETIKVQQVPTYSAPPIPKSSNQAKDKPPGEVGYKQLSITRPARDSTVFYEEQGVPVEVALEPALKEDHVVTLYLDGQRVASGPSTRFSVKEVFRGSHTLVAAVEDSTREQLLRSEPVTFHLTQHTKDPTPKSQNPNNPYNLAPLNPYKAPKP